MTGLRRGLPWLASAGLVVTVLGTFLPWFHSGGVQRHSYQTADAIARLVLVDSAFLRTALRLWLGVPLLAAVCLGLFALGFARTAATLTALLAISVGTVALLATVRSGGTDGLIGITPTGPVTTLAGAGVALAGALGTFAVRARRSHPPVTARTGGHP
ncbi:hypothetical protein SAMN05421835_10171 [Amycolatopsis sacchari]|uniref:Tryptophan-associated transmembrane protein (Trp_oprn_chp) n=1 Tax=Amycolatopsis sacchari TaxID=115433 RepID=A0A1I3JBM1_9PSEU|nr:hypothetical protein [Amycolatopsis sacchari]SFI57677.1 hypothetical protein SAMN05421835_10171 [Amycolatopsis sacchari]